MDEAYTAASVGGTPEIVSPHPGATGIACLGFDYYDVGYQTGEMAVRILNGTPASEIDVELGKTFSYSVNIQAAETYGVIIPQSILDKAVNIYEE